MNGRCTARLAATTPDPLRAHGVALVGHRRGADLLLLEGLLDLAEVGEQADVDRPSSTPRPRPRPGWPAAPAAVPTSRRRGTRARREKDVRRARPHPGRVSGTGPAPAAVEGGRSARGGAARMASVPICRDSRHVNTSTRVLCLEVLSCRIARRVLVSGVSNASTTISGFSSRTSRTASSLESASATTLIRSVRSSNAFSPSRTMASGSPITTVVVVSKLSASIWRPAICNPARGIVPASTHTDDSHIENVQRPATVPGGMARRRLSPKRAPARSPLLPFETGTPPRPAADHPNPAKP